MTDGPAETSSELQALKGMEPALQAAGIVVWALDLEAGHADRLDVVGRLPGLPSGTTFDRFVHPQDRARFDAALAAAVAGGHPYDIEFRLVLADGSVRWVHESAVMQRGADGRPMRLSGITVDVTARKPGGEALERELLQGIIDGMPAMITLYEPDTHVLRVNRAFERITGWTAEDARRIDMLAACYPDPAVRERVHAFMQSAEPGWRDFPMATRDGEVIDTSWANIPLSDGRQVGIGLDLRDRRATEATLRESENRYRQVVEISREAIWIHCEERIVFANARAAELFGAGDPARLLGRPVFELVHPDERPRAMQRTRQILDRREPVPLTEMRYLGPGGSTVVMEVQAVPFSFKGRPAILAVGRDVTERKEGEQRQALLMAELDHRVRNVLASIQAMVALTGRNVASKEDYAAALQGRIAAMAQAHGLLTRRRWQGVDLIDIVRTALRAYGEAVSIDGRPGCVLRAKDAVNVALILHELATNAAKYGALSVPGGRVAVRWAVEGDGQGTRARLLWTESGGPPVSPPTRQGFGSQLIQGALPRTKLGFEPGGVRCELVLRLARDQAARTRLPPPAPPPPGRTGAVDRRSLAGLRVLLVEDEPLAAMEMRMTLEAAGAEVAGVAATLEGALALVEAAVSAAVMDVNLNGEMVYPAAERLVARGVPVVLATGYDAHSITIPEALSRLPVLQKPVAPEALVLCLAGLVADAPSPDGAGPDAGTRRAVSARRRGATGG